MSICDLIHGVIYGLYIGEGRLLDSYTIWQVHSIKFRNRGGCVYIITYLKEYVCLSDFLYLNYKTNIKINLFEYSKLTCRYIFKIILKTI
jgi:hypothetical protein